MDIVDEIKEILALQNPSEQEDRLSLLNDEFEYGSELNKADVVEGTRLLLAAALQENDQAVRQKFFHTINKAVAHYDIRTRIDWDKLVASLSPLGKWELEYALEIIGISGQARYLPVLEEYAHHVVDPEIRGWVQDAIDEINYQVAHASDPQKGS